MAYTPKFFFNLASMSSTIRAALRTIDTQLYAALYKALNLEANNKVFIPFTIPATELAAGTTIECVMPAGVSGVISELYAVVQTSIVTGGVITLKNFTTDVPGISVTIPDAAAKGFTVSDTVVGTVLDANHYITAGTRLQVVPSAAFNGGGAINGFVVVVLPEYTVP